MNRQSPKLCKQQTGLNVLGIEKMDKIVMDVSEPEAPFLILWVANNPYKNSLTEKFRLRDLSHNK